MIKDVTDRTMYNRLARWYDDAAAHEKRDGMQWYEDARNTCIELAHCYDLDPYVVACVVSALSPNNKWERNIVDADTVIQAWINGLTPQDVKVCTYNANKNKAFKILDGTVDIAASSPKTHAFAMNIGRDSAMHVTVDKWHLRACQCNPGDRVNMELQTSITPKQYRRIEAITAKLANYHGIKAHQVQAIIWLNIRNSWSA